MQSPFSFRRLAPAFDYLGSPFSAFFRPLLLGFPDHTFVLSFLFLSARPSLSFVSFCLASGYSASCSSFQLSSRFSSQRLSGAPRFLSSPWLFPLPLHLISHVLLPVLLTQLSCIVSFRPSLLRSRSRSAGAHLSLSLKMFFHGFHFLSSASALGF